MQFSETAKRLLDILKNSSEWHQHCTDKLFPAPKYSKENRSEYWQHEANIYGNPQNRVILLAEENNGVAVFGDFKPNISRPYSSQTSDAYLELKRAGLANERNNGYNEYVYFLK